MNTKKAKIIKSRFILALMIFTLSIFGKYDDSVHAEALPNFPEGVDLVSAADCIMSYLTSAGMFIANRDWIDELYTSFGGGAGFYINDLYQNGLLTLDEAGHYVSTGLDTALESQSAWSNLHLDTLFNVSAEEAAAGGGVAATGAGTIAGCIGGVATTGVLPLAIGVTGAYWGGIGLGTLIAHATGLYGKNVVYGLDVLTSPEFLESIPLGGSAYTTLNDPSLDNHQFITVEPGLFGGGYLSGQNSSGNIYTFYIYNVTNTSKKYYIYNPSTHQSYAYSVNVNSNSNPFQSYKGYTDGWTIFSRNMNTSDVKAGLTNGSIVPKQRYSPDIITPDGNAIGEYTQEGGIRIPSMIPQINPDSGSVVPGGASREDWLRWANGAKGNNEINQPDDNAEIFQEILDAIKRLTPTPTPNPNPNPNPNPTPVPKPDYDPEQPNQPEYDPKETEGPSDVTNGSPWTTPDLLDKFPFCLPRDVLRCFEKLDGGARQAPSISWHFTTPLGIDFDFDLNLDDYEGIASLLRTLELIAFVIGLALATRNLIGR